MPNLEINFNDYVKELVKENQKAMPKELKKYLLDGYQICRLYLEKPTKENDSDIKLSLKDEIYSVAEEDVIDYNNEFVNHNYYILTGNNDSISKEPFYPLDENVDYLVMHYSKKNHTQEQIAIFNNFFDIFVIKMIEEKFKDNDLAKKINLVDFAKSLFNNLLNGEVESTNLQKQIEKALDSYFDSVEEQIKFEKENKENYLKTQNIVLLDELRKLNLYIYTLNKNSGLLDNKTVASFKLILNEEKKVLN